MRSVQCRIADKANPQLWIEIEIGVDDGSQPFWNLTGKSPVTLNNFTATGGTWEYATIGMTVDGRDETSSGIDILTDGTDGFALAHVRRGFYELLCGQSRSGHGFRWRDDGPNVRFRMDVLCV